MYSARFFRSYFIFFAVMLSLSFYFSSTYAEALFFEDFESPSVLGYQKGQTPGAWVRSSAGYKSGWHGLVGMNEGAFLADQDNQQGYAFRYGNTGITTLPGEIGELGVNKLYEIAFDIAKDSDNTKGGLSYSLLLLALDEVANRNDARSIPNDGELLLEVRGQALNQNAFTRIQSFFIADESVHAQSIGKDLAVRIKGLHGAGIVDNLSVSLVQARMIYPEKDAILSNNNIDLRWNNIELEDSSEVSVDLWFGKDSNAMEKLLSDAADISSLRVKPVTAGTYYWRVDNRLVTRAGDILIPGTIQTFTLKVPLEEKPNEDDDDSPPDNDEQSQLPVEDAKTKVLMIENFEKPPVSGYQQRVNPDLWVASTVGFNSGWHGLIHEDSGDFTESESSNQQKYAFRYGGTGLTSIEGSIDKLKLNVAYKISFDAIKDQHNNGQKYQVELLAIPPEQNRKNVRSLPSGAILLHSERGSAPANGLSETVTFEFSADSITQSSAVGKDIAIRIVGSHGAAIIDNVRVVANFPNLVAPPYQSIVPGGDVQLVWENNSADGISEVDNADTYVDVWFGNNPETQTKVLSNAKNATSVTVQADSLGVYFWQVNTYDNSGNLVEGVGYEFEVVDTDGDGLSDEYELLHTEPASPVSMGADDDPDLDGLSNLEEFQVNTLPKTADTDGDQLLDGEEVFGKDARPATDPLKADTDGDAINDYAETNTGYFFSEQNTGTNPILRDTDENGLSDWYEITKEVFQGLGADNDLTDLPFSIPDPDSSGGSSVKPLKVYILAGQSNMVGMGEIEPLGVPGSLRTLTQENGKFQNLIASDNEWTTRNDVYVYEARLSNFPYQQGLLTPGVINSKQTIGPEIQFGHIMGEYHDEKVVIIKIAEGNRSLAWDFRPPSSGRNKPDSQWEGREYRLMIEGVQNVMSNLEASHPTYSGQGAELAGFVWFQGHKDSGSSAHQNEYESNLVNLINDVRNDLNVPELPFVVASIGFHGENMPAKYFPVWQAQMSVGDANQHPQFANNVRSLNTRPLWIDGSLSPSSEDYHYNRNAEFYALAGESMAWKMLELLDESLIIGGSSTVQEVEGSSEQEQSELEPIAQQGPINPPVISSEPEEATETNEPEPLPVPEVSGVISILADLKSSVAPGVELSIDESTALIEAFESSKKQVCLTEDSMNAALDLVEIYDAQVGALFTKESPTAKGWRRNNIVKNIHWAMFNVMQAIVDHCYTAENLTVYERLASFKFKSADRFPGAVPVPEVSATHRVSISASYPDTAGWTTQGQKVSARKPTGTYAAPGSLVTVKVPAALVNKGFQIRVGGHSWDMTKRKPIKRLDRISLLYDITVENMQVSNPFGGGVYIEVPKLADAGVREIEISGAVRSPYFSMKSFHKTTPAEWLLEREHQGPWADFQTEKYMMMLPTDWISKWDDPTQTLADYDKAMDVINDLMGFPQDRGKETMFPSVDVIFRSAVHAPGYPSVNITYDPNREYSGRAKSHLLNGPTTVPYYFFHEQGHAYFFTKFPGESESTVNLLHTAVMNQAFGMDMDTAFRHSLGFKKNTFRTLDNTAAVWMTSFNFSPRNKPMATGEKAYQLKGHAKLVDIAQLFGWDKLNTFWGSFVEAFEAGNRPKKNQDKLLLRMSRSVGKDIRPLLHFWGSPPINAEQLESEINDENIPASKEIYDRLVEYRFVIPKNNAEFQTFAQSWWGRKPKIGGAWTEVEQARQYDAESFWQDRGWDYSGTDPNKADGEVYSEQTAIRIRERLDSIIDLYFPNGAP